MALEAALVEAGRVSTDAIDTFVDYMEHRLGPHHGARVVARAWVDPDFKARLLADGTAAMAELGIAGAEGDNVRVVENTERRAQPRRLHAVLVLPVATARDPADLVQELRLPVPGRRRATCRAARVRHRARRRRRGAGVGLQRGDPLPRPPRPSCRHGLDDRGGAGRPRHPDGMASTSNASPSAARCRLDRFDVGADAATGSASALVDGAGLHASRSRATSHDS